LRDAAKPGLATALALGSDASRYEEILASGLAEQVLDDVR
jgi:hypothetical protein